MINDIVALMPENEDVTDMLKDSLPTLPQVNGAQRPIVITKVDPVNPVKADPTKAIYVSIQPGEEQKFSFDKNSHIFVLKKIGDYKYKGAWIAEGQTAESYTVPSSISASTSIECNNSHPIKNDLLSDAGVEGSTNHPLPFKLKVNGEIILIGSAVVAGDDGSGVDPVDLVLNSDKDILATGLSSVAEETNRGSLKMKKITDSTVLTKAQTLIDAAGNDDKSALRANVVRSILDHADMGTATSIKMAKTALSLSAGLANGVTDIVAFKPDSTVKLSDLEKTEGFYAPLVNDTETIVLDYGDSKTATFTRQTVASEIQYTLTINGNLTVYKKTGATNLTIDNNNTNYTLTGYLVSGDIIELGGRLINISSVIDGGESVTLEYANVTWTNVYDPNTTSFEDNIAAANPTVPLQPYNREINIDGLVIPAGEMKFVKFGNGTTTVNFSN
jgi:hypothetical protein